MQRIIRSRCKRVDMEVYLVTINVCNLDGDWVLIASGSGHYWSWGSHTYYSTSRAGSFLFAGFRYWWGLTKRDVQARRHEIHTSRFLV